LTGQGSHLADRPEVARPDGLPFKGESLYEDGDNIQMKMKAEGVFSPSDRQVANIVCSKLRLRWVGRLSVYYEVHPWRTIVQCRD